MPGGRGVPAARYRAAVGVDETRPRTGGPGYPPPAAAGGDNSGSTIEFLCGDWDVERRISDRRAGQDGLFRGTARFQSTADSRMLEYTEDGELRFGSHCGPARRRLLLCGREDGAADVRFADGREFYRLDLRSENWQAEHPCRADRYFVTVTRLSPDSFTEVWQVAGPDKDYQLETTYRRITYPLVSEGPSGSGAATCRAALTRLPGGPR
jgi:hypothetical protein